MNSCDFCKICWQTVLAIAVMLGLFTGMNGLIQRGINQVCFEAKLDRHHLNECDKSDSPVEKTVSEKE